jgi:hypothetical protein
MTMFIADVGVVFAMRETMITARYGQDVTEKFALMTWTGR